MEAVPRLPMISFPGRISVKPTEFSEHLKRYIRDHYHENPESYNNEIAELESLRRSAVNASTDFMGCSTLKKYYCQLHYLTSRFPLDETGIKLSFNWCSAFDQNHSESGDINLEMNSILYNISTLHTALGALDSRTTPDGMKISCTHFQCASWAFQVLSQSSRNDGEITSLLMTFMTNLSLSQAQECILEKSMTDNRKPNIIAKVAMQVVEYLRTTLKNLESFKKSSTNAVDLIGSKLIKAWQRHCEFKVSYYLSVTLFHQGLQSEEQQKMGERLSFYQGAVDKLDEASKLAKGLDKAKVIGETLTFANDVILGKLTAAQKENEFVYHEKVPPLESLPEVKGASLVKGIPFSFTDKEVAGQDIFGRLVPLEAHQASSLYSEEKAKLLRRVTSEIQEKNEELDMYLASMQLDSLAFEENFDAIPQELVDSCADLNSRDAFKVLTEIMAKISNIYHDLQTKITETELLIKEEDAKESEFCVISGTKRAPCQILTEARREAAKCREAHEAAGASNQALHNAITQHRHNIALLSKPLKTLLEALPSVAGVESEGDKATRQEVQRLLAKVREMQAQRSEFEGQLRMHLQEDDVTKELVTNQGDLEGFFEKQLSKHTSLISSSPLESVSALDSTPPVIDLAQLAKPKRLLSVIDPLTNDDTLTLLAQETERFSKLVLGLDKRSLNGPTNLEIKWNELVDTLETKCSNLKVSVGRCYPLKNRFPDNLSFDATRVPLPSARDDYINASYVQLSSVADSIPLIITQAPMPNTFSDFWTMVWENQVEIVVCLNSDAEVKGQVYLPRDAVEPFDCGNFSLHLKQIRPAANEAWIQRTLQLTHNTLKSTKVVLHIQFLTWPPSAMPESPGLFLQFINEVHNLQRQQRNKLKPVVAHCVSGTGRTGVFAVLSSFIKCIQNTGNLCDVWKLVIELSQQRRMSLQDRTHLLFLYSAALYYAQEVLMKRGILTDKATFEEGPREKTHVRHPSADLLSSDLNRMKAKLGFDEAPPGDTNLSRSGSQSSILSVGSSTGVSSHATPPPPSHATPPPPSSVSPSPTHSAIGTKLGAADLPPNLAASLDPNCLVLNPPKPKKITRENFLGPSPARGLGHIDHNTDPSDPLSGLDPLWNLKKA